MRVEEQNSIKVLEIGYFLHLVRICGEREVNSEAFLRNLEVVVEVAVRMNDTTPTEHA